MQSLNDIVDDILGVHVVAEGALNERDAAALLSKFPDVSGSRPRWTPDDVRDTVVVLVESGQSSDSVASALIEGVCSVLFNKFTDEIPTDPLMKLTAASTSTISEPQIKRIWLRFAPDGVITVAQLAALLRELKKKTAFTNSRMMEEALTEFRHSRGLATRAKASKSLFSRLRNVSLVALGGKAKVTENDAPAPPAVSAPEVPPIDQTGVASPMVLSDTGMVSASTMTPVKLLCDATSQTEATDATASGTHSLPSEATASNEDLADSSKPRSVDSYLAELHAKNMLLLEMKKSLFQQTMSHLDTIEAKSFGEIDASVKVALSPAVQTSSSQPLADPVNANAAYGSPPVPTYQQDAPSSFLMPNELRQPALVSQHVLGDVDADIARRRREVSAKAEALRRYEKLEQEEQRLLQEIGMSGSRGPGMGVSPVSVVAHPLSEDRETDHVMRHLLPYTH